ncbi:MAG: hypothetical protein FJ020_02450 [Chloroflexi bacterium]|nr:hypothetical protein [Chloroflexota bacterium]
MEERLKCPYCEGEMVSGEVYVKGKILTFLLVGASWSWLWFRGDSGSKAEQIVGGWYGDMDKKAAQRCPSCGAVIIKGSRR